MARGHRSWVTSRTECPNCHFRFNFRHSKWGSVSAVRYGSTWTFACPSCHQKVPFLLKKGSDPELVTIDDQSFRSFFLMTLAGSITLVVAVVAIYFASSEGGNLMFFVPGFITAIASFAIYMMWIAAIGRSAAKTNIRKPE